MPTADLFRARTYSTWRAWGEPIHPVAAAWLLLARWIERTRQCKALRGLDDHQLRDIGITGRDAARECGKPFWG